MEQKRIIRSKRNRRPLLYENKRW